MTYSKPCQQPLADAGSLKIRQHVEGVNLALVGQSGAFAAVRKERLWGATLSEMAYAWPDLKRAVAPSGPGATP